MSTLADPFEVVGALLRHDFDTYERGLSKVEPRQFAAAMTAAFSVAADRRFGEGKTVADIVEFVAAARAQYDSTGDEIDPGAAERILRTVAFGEDGLIGDIDEKALGRVESLLLLPLLDDAQGWDDARLNEFLTASRSLAQQWSA